MTKLDLLGVGFGLVCLYLWTKHVEKTKEKQVTCPVENSPDFKECRQCNHCAINESFSRSMSK